MWPRIGPIPTYGVLYHLGIVVHFWVSRRVARRLGLKRRVWMLVSASYFVGMIIGAKALYDLRHSHLDLQALFSLRHYLEGGFWGGLLAYLVLALPLCMLLTKRRRSACDLVALTIPIPWALAKVGCLLNGCCYGRPSSLPWAITFPQGPGPAPAGVPLHPTQVYEIITMVLLLLVFRKLDRERWRGTMLLWFLAIYGLARAATDVFRGDTDRYIYLGPITLTQAASLAGATLSIVLLVLWARRNPAAEKTVGSGPDQG
ncbi:MAG: hypothetical protein AMJ81_04920 [Phycisphaerae bacterium SM23_33]|nr:MAG: hypothetical protein AMJ81_04920 [Phycisphaerae bacterium SM23_33]